MANSPPDLVLVVVVEVVKEVLCSCLKVLEGWWKALVDVSLHSNTKVSAKKHSRSLPFLLAVFSSCPDRFQSCESPGPAFEDSSLS